MNGSSQSVTIKDGAAYIHATSGDEGPYDFICPDRKTLMVAEYQITRKNCIKGKKEDIIIIKYLLNYFL